MEKNIARLAQEPPDHLHHLAEMLHLFAHRNKNQHRRSIWWRSFSTFRKSLDRAVADVEFLRSVPATHSDRVKKKAENKRTSVHLQQLLQHWQDIMVPRWFRAFSQVVADGRFAVLGLVLTAVLSDACRLLGIISAYEGLAQTKVEEVLNQFAKETWDDAATSKPSAVTDPSLKGGEDAGEPVARNAVLGELSDNAKLAHKEAKPTTGEQPPLKRKPDEGRSVPKKAKKRRKGNAIDDLFSGLG